MKDNRFTILILAILPLIVFAGPSATALRMQEYETKGILSRTLLPEYAESEHFRVWYTTDTSSIHVVSLVDTINPEEGIPDYVELALEYFEYSYHVQCESLGYNEPLPDSSIVPDASNVGGNDKWDAYMKGIGGYYYGATSWDHRFSRNNTSTGYMELNSDMSVLPGYENNPYDALAVTCAHEFQHMVQFAYYDDRSLVWQMECNATLMEEICYDDINDYYNYLPFYLNYQHVPLNTANGSHEYGSVLWTLFLYEKYGIELIRSWWELTESASVFTGLRVALAAYDSDMDSEYLEFCKWNHMIGKNYTEGYGYSEGENYHMPNFEDIIDIDEILDIDIESNVDEYFFGDITGPYVCKLHYIPIEDRLMKTADYESGVWVSLEDIIYEDSWGILISGIRPDDSEVIPYDPDMVHAAYISKDSLHLGIDEIWRYDGIVVAPIVFYDSGTPFSMRISSSGKFTPIKNEVKSPYPNPVKSGDIVYFPFVLDETGDVLLSIFDNAGMPIYQIEDKFHAGPHHKFPYWDTDDIAAGIYHYKMILPNDEKSGTIIVK